MFDSKEKEKYLNNKNSTLIFFYFIYLILKILFGGLILRLNSNPDF
jgi:hypothetical protein